MKKLLIAAMMMMVAGMAQAQNYGTVIMVNGARTESWTAVSGAAATVTSGGVYTNAIAYTNVYRVSGTNYAGRLPTGSNVVAIWTGSATSNAVLLTWTRKYGILAHVIELSLDGGTTWTNWIAVGAAVTNWTDTGSNTWQTTNFSAIPEIGSPTYPWDGSGTTGAVAAAMATAIVAQATADAAMATGATAQAQADEAMATSSTAVASIDLHQMSTNPHTITPGMIGAVGTDGASSMNGHLVMNAYKGVITGTNSLILPLSANADAEYSQGGGHIALLSKSLGGAVQIVAYDPTGAVRRVEFYVGSDMNVPAATIESDGFHGVGSGITGLTPEQCGSIASSNFPTSTAWQVSWETDTNTIVVTDAGDTNAPSNPQSWGVLQNAYLATNTNGWYLYGTEYRDPGSFGYYTMTSGVPGNWVGSGDPATGTVSVVYAQHLVTNSITWPGIVTNIVGVSTQIQYYSTIGNLTNVIRLP